MRLSEENSIKLVLCVCVLKKCNSLSLFFSFDHQSFVIRNHCWLLVFLFAPLSLCSLSSLFNLKNFCLLLFSHHLMVLYLSEPVLDHLRIFLSLLRVRPTIPNVLILACPWSFLPVTPVADVSVQER